MKLCQRIFWCLAFVIFWQTFKSIGSIEQSSELKKIPNLYFAQNLIETYNMPVNIYVSQFDLKMFAKLHFFNTNHNFRVRILAFLN